MEREMMRSSKEVTVQKDREADLQSGYRVWCAGKK